MTHVSSQDGTLIAFDRTGSGPPLILVDGALCSRGFGPSARLARLLEVRVDQCGTGTARFDFLHRLFARIRLAKCRVGVERPVDGDVGARVGERERDRAADTDAAAGHERAAASHRKALAHPLPAVRVLLRLSVLARHGIPNARHSARSA